MTRAEVGSAASAPAVAGRSRQAWAGDTVPRFPPPRLASSALCPSLARVQLVTQSGPAGQGQQALPLSPRQAWADGTAALRAAIRVHPARGVGGGPLLGPGRLPPACWALRALWPVGGGRRVAESWFPGRTRAGRAGPVLLEAVLRPICLCVPTQHMIKYRYIPFTHGKRTYKGKEDVGKTFAS